MEFKLKTPTQIYEELIKEASLSVPGFTEQPAEVQNNLIQETALSVYQVELAQQEVLNNMLPATAGQQAFIVEGEGIGIYYKANPHTLVDVVFSSYKEGIIIAKGTQLSDSGASIFVQTTRDIVLYENNNTVQCSALLEGVIDINANTITKLVNPIEEITVNNPEKGFTDIQTESFEEYQNRVYTAKNIQSVSDGTALVYSNINKVAGVTTIYINKLITKENPPYTEIVIQGGNDYDIALAIEKSIGLSSLTLASNPSDGNLARKISVNLKVYNTDINILFTRPKIVPLEINIKLKSSIFLNVSETKRVLFEALNIYIKKIGLQQNISVQSLDYVLIEALALVVKREELGSIEWSFFIEGKTVDPIEGFFVSPFDVMYLLKNVYVELL